jgi:hypothetical protein
MMKRSRTESVSEKKPGKSSDGSGSFGHIYVTRRNHKSEVLDLKSELKIEREGKGSYPT